ISPIRLCPLLTNAPKTSCSGPKGLKFSAMIVFWTRRGSNDPPSDRTPAPPLEWDPVVRFSTMVQFRIVPWAAMTPPPSPDWPVRLLRAPAVVPVIVALDRFRGSAEMPPPWPPATLPLTVLLSTFAVNSAEIPPPGPWQVLSLIVLLSAVIDTVQMPPPNSLL